MKKIYYIYVCLGVLLLTALPAKAASEAEFGKLAKTYTLHKDGSQEMRVYKELTLFTHAAMNGLYGESFIVYNPAYQELKIHESYTRQKDGKIVKTPENAFVEVLSAAAADAPAYNGLKEMVVVHTGLELGATICLDYSVITRPGYLPGLDVYVPVEELSPVKEYICSVSVPEDKPLNYALINGKATPVVKNENGSKVVTWTLKNIPAYYPMESTPALSGNIPVILANTYPSMADALKVLKSQFTAAHEKEVMALAQKLLQGKRFVEFVAKNQLEYIVIEASKRLDIMTKGRYVLEIDDNLNFVIRDNYNGGLRRSIKTLSGGETFLTSLALALALSSQIQLKGSAPLEFFFLDEGFGSLDNELLDIVMESLEKLHSEQLSVGIISHVEELKNRVPVKLIVTPNDGGNGSKINIEYS